MSTGMVLIIGGIILIIAGIIVAWWAWLDY
jgi:hypothetical protein